MPDVAPELVIDGQAYGGWTGVTVVRDIEQMAGSFRLDLTDKWPGIADKRAVKPGLACRLENAGDTLVTGWLDVVDVAYDPGNHSISATGRDRTGDLVDCTAAPDEWDEQPLTSIAREICNPFGIPIVVGPGAHSSVRKFKVEPSETAFSAIERLARIKGRLVTSTPDGKILITRADNAPFSGAVLKTGKGGNVLSASAKFDHSERFSTVTVKGQDGGFDLETAEEAAEPSGKSRDTGISRYRPLTVLAEEAVDAAACEERAQWEVSVRSGRARRATVTVQGWYHPGGIWRPLTLVDCEIPEINIDLRMLVTAVRYGLSEQDGTTAELTLADPLAFTGLELPEDTENDWGWGS